MHHRGPRHQVGARRPYQIYLGRMRGQSTDRLRPTVRTTTQRQVRPGLGLHGASVAGAAANHEHTSPAHSGLQPAGRLPRGDTSQERQEHHPRGHAAPCARLGPSWQVGGMEL